MINSVEGQQCLHLFVQSVVLFTSLQSSDHYNHLFFRSRFYKKLTKVTVAFNIIRFVSFVAFYRNTSKYNCCFKCWIYFKMQDLLKWIKCFGSITFLVLPLVCKEKTRSQTTLQYHYDHGTLKIDVRLPHLLLEKMLFINLQLNFLICRDHNQLYHFLPSTFCSFDLSHRSDNMSPVLSFFILLLAFSKAGKYKENRTGQHVYLYRYDRVKLVK